MSAEAVNTLLANLAQMPALQGMFDLRTLFVLLAKRMGLTNVDSIPTPSQAQIDLIQSAKSPTVDSGDTSSSQTAPTNQPVLQDTGVANATAIVNAQQQAQPNMAATPLKN